MMQTTLSKCGNSKGVRVPADAVSALGLTVGAHASVEVDPARSAIVLTFNQPRRRYSRSAKLTLEEFAAGWTGCKVGGEPTSSDLGSEVVE